MNNNNTYDDIINMKHPVSTKHPQMSMLDRAAQFSPFAALTGYDEAVKETARLTTERVELDESSKAILNEKLHMVLESRDEVPKAMITYFVPDEKKSGGVYLTVTGTIQKIDAHGHRLLMSDGTWIPIDDIYEIDSSLFRNMDW